MSRGHEEKVLDNVTTTNNYVDSKLVEFLNYVRAKVWIKNTHGSNSIKYKILARASLQDSDAGWEEEVSEQTLAAGASADHDITDAWALIKIQVKSATTDAAGTVDAFIVKKRY